MLTIGRDRDSTLLFPVGQVRHAWRAASTFRRRYDSATGRQVSPPPLRAGLSPPREPREPRAWLPGSIWAALARHGCAAPAHRDRRREISGWEAPGRRGRSRRGTATSGLELSCGTAQCRPFWQGSGDFSVPTERRLLVIEAAPKGTEDDDMNPEPADSPGP